MSERDICFDNNHKNILVLGLEVVNLLDHLPLLKEQFLSIGEMDE